jgi:membrane-anchored glycerophosphoryl diester phosphodiesterase (GDPDase)
MSPVATLVDTTALWETVVFSLIAGVGVTLIFSIALLGVARFAEHNREGRAATAVAFGGLALLAAAAFLAAIVFGIIVMTSK